MAQILMRYEHTPRPLVEDHHHIRELIEHQDRRVEDRQRHRDHEAAVQERGKELASLQPRDTIPFWCERCKLDFQAETILEVERGWENPDVQIAFYRTKCFAGHWCIRHGLDKSRDPYYERSRAVARDRGEHRADMLQPWDSGYDMLYRNKNQHRP